MALGVALLGCTGSIGQSVLRVLARHPDQFRLVAVAARRNAEMLGEQVARFNPRLAVLLEEGAAAPAMNGTRLRYGREALLEAATSDDVDVVINAVVGAAGLEATLAALHAGKRLALANKESLVAGGPLVLEALKRGGGELVPIDSEHSAILQCLRGARDREVARIILTASGGPFRQHSAEALTRVTRAEALHHPTWEMGAKITIDSATLANKALEVVEAHFLFGLSYDQIDVVVHPQSVIHSMVEFVDGSVLSQMGAPSMELPILYALTHPERIQDARPRFDAVSFGALTFEPVDTERFPAFALGVQAGRAGGTTPAAFNAANEVAVEGFLSDRLPFSAIANVIEAALDTHQSAPVDALETVLEADRSARAAAHERIRQLC
jgi:1-deoxy-D-xylulose-5-phosphate reductoisomerase